MYQKYIHSLEYKKKTFLDIYVCSSSCIFSGIVASFIPAFQTHYILLKKNNINMTSKYFQMKMISTMSAIFYERNIKHICIYVLLFYLSS